MYLIKPSVELWPAPEDWHEQVARQENRRRVLRNAEET